MYEEPVFFRNLNDNLALLLQSPWQFCSDVSLPITELEEFSSPTGAFLSGGKHLRAKACAIGWSCAQTSELPEQPPSHLVELCAGIELFQAAALVHDDIIDSADTRRGIPTARVAFSSSRQQYGQRFGDNAALVFGDLLMAAAYSYIHKSLSSLPETLSERITKLFDLMCAEVAYGQFLDLRNECSELSWGNPPTLEASLKVYLHKASHYSVVYPLLLGAIMGGANEKLIADLQNTSEPLGIAYQLRDDDLDLFGDTHYTGKSVGDDIREGKRTPLLALAWQNTDDKGREYLTRFWGSPDVNSTVLENIKHILIGSLARKKHDDLIQENYETSMQHLASLEINEQAKQALSELAKIMIFRTY